jgi:hypothetical protein
MPQSTAEHSGSYLISNMDNQDTIVGYANGDVAWIHNADTNGICRITGRDNTNNI